MTPIRKAIFAALVLLAWLAAPAAAATMGSIGKELINVRTGPGLKFPVAFQGEMGYPLQVDKKRGKWLPVRDWKGRSGWVYRPLVSEVHTVIILAETANIRQGPSLKNRVEGYASKGEIYKVVAIQGHWVKIAYYLENETRGWIYQNLVWGVQAGRHEAKH
jgi:N-acetylmuramoyl-L-alanine amidase